MSDLSRTPVRSHRWGPSRRHSTGVALAAALVPLVVTSVALAGGGVIWPEGSTQFVISDLIVSDSLTIEPGVTVLINGGVEIIVASGGTLTVAGTPEAPVSFGPNSASRWDGITFELGSNGSIRHATMGFTNAVGLLIENSSPVIQDCVIEDVAGIAPGGAARGIRVNGALAAPVITGCLVQNVVGAVGAVGSNTGAAGNGPNGGDGTFFAPNGGNGGGGANGGTGGTGSVGGPAIGIAIDADASVSMALNHIRAITGGAGGKGGNGGGGGDGGDGGDAVDGIFPGTGGNGAKGGNGGKGGTGGVGGAATGVLVDTFDRALAFHQLLVAEIRSGAGGGGGGGGAGGDGGVGGNGLSFSGTPIFNTDGGDGGNGGTGGAQGNGGAGGIVRAVHVPGDESVVAFSQCTMAQLVGGLGGAPGFANFGGDGGGGGFAVDPADPGTDGSDGANGGAGTTGAFGAREGVSAADDVLVELRNSILALGGVDAGVALAASAGAVVTVAHSCLADYTTVSQGAVTIGPGTLLADPGFVNPGAGDFALTAASVCVDAGDAVSVSYRRDAHTWIGAVEAYEPRAFDEFAPGLAGATGCLAGDGNPVILNLAGGTMTLSGFTDGGVASCAIVDGSTTPRVSDGSLTSGTARLRLDFDPPVWAFYAYFGSVDVGDKGRMAIYSSNSLIEEVIGLPSVSNTAATGFGFLRTVPIDRIDLSVDLDAGSVVGAFTGLVAGEPSLGTIDIPGYVGPGGSSNIAFDFACAFADTGMGSDLAGASRVVDGDDDAEAVIDLGALEFQGVPRPLCAADFDGDGLVGGADLGTLLSEWGTDGGSDLDGDGTVTGADLGELLAAWGACPE